MIALAHRGYWHGKDEQNTLTAFRRALDLGFGIETDIRDRMGDLVIAHDPPVANALPLAEFLGLAAAYSAPLALNIKADGLAADVVRAVHAAGIKRWFVFDMSVPDCLAYRGLGAPLFTRRSEYELPGPLERAAAGVWLDAFETDWWTADTIRGVLDAGKEIAIVSPELHRRTPDRAWAKLAQLDHPRRDAVMVCTDFPERFRAALGG